MYIWNDHANNEILAVLRESDKSETRKRLLEERQRVPIHYDFYCKVKKSICQVNESEPILWEMQEQMERKKHRVEVFFWMRGDA